MPPETELELKKELERYKLIVQGVNDAIWDWDLTKKQVYFSPRWCQIRGLDPSRVKGLESEWSTGIHPDDFPKVMSALQDHFEKKTDFFFIEYRIRVSDGSWKWILDRGVAQWNAEGKAVRMAGAETDITDWKWAQSKLLESERRLSTLIGNLAGVVYRSYAEPPWTILYMGGSSVTLTGYTPEEIVSPEIGSFGALIVPEDMPFVVEEVAKAVSEERHFELNYRIRGKGGEVRWVWERGRFIGEDANGIGMLEGIMDDITRQKETEAALKKSQERFDFALSRSHTGFWVLDLSNLTVERTLEHDQIFGYETLRPEWAYEDFLEHVLPDDRVDVDRKLKKAIDAKRDCSFECRIYREDSSVRWIWVVGGHETINDGSGQFMVGVIQDITERKLSEDANARYSAELRSIFEALPDIYFRMMPDGTILDYQAQTKGELYTEPENFLGKRMQDVLPSNVGQLFQQKLNEMRNSNELLAFGYELVINDELRYFDARFNRIPVSNQLVCVIRDISDVKKSEEELYRLAHHDTLTGLPNRLHMNEHLAYAIKRADRNQSELAVIFFDLDNFKIINDSFGHDVGDELLKKTARRLLKHVRKSDLVTRISGDEFIIIMEGVSGRKSVEAVIHKLLNEFQKEVSLFDHRVKITASLGVCLYPHDARTPEELLRNADVAMYRAKEDGRNTYQFYQQEMTATAIERVFLENSLRNAIKNEEFYLNYQPQIDLKTGAIVGLEALIRWRHQEHGEVLPEKFIPFAEESHLIVEIGEWVLREACSQAKNWLDRGVSFGHVAVNISGIQIRQGGLFDMVKAILAETGLPAFYLELEVTESYIMKQHDKAGEQLQKIRDLGVSLAIDDFGTGYSSLSYLKKLPVHKLKVDQEFIRDIPDDENDMAISKAIIAMSSSLGLKVIAEGVETQAQVNFLNSAGCHEIQGFFYSKPLGRDELEQLLIRCDGKWG